MHYCHRTVSAQDSQRKGHGLHHFLRQLLRDRSELDVGDDVPPESTFAVTPRPGTGARVVAAPSRGSFLDFEVVLGLELELELLKRGCWKCAKKAMSRSRALAAFRAVMRYTCHTVVPNIRILLTVTVQYIHNFV